MLNKTKTVIESNWSEKKQTANVGHTVDNPGEKYCFNNVIQGKSGDNFCRLFSMVVKMPKTLFIRIITYFDQCPLAWIRSLFNRLN